MMYTDCQMVMLFSDFAHISIEFSGIFTTSKCMGMRLDPRLLHKWKSPSCKLKSPHRTLNLVNHQISPWGCYLPR